MRAGLAVLLLSLAPVEPIALHVSQADASNLLVYADVVGAGDTVVVPPPNQLTVTIGETPATVDSVRAFDKTPGGVAYVFLIDVSLSLSADRFNAMRQAMGTWVDHLRPKDRVAIVTFGDSVTRQIDFTTSADSLRTIIAALKPTDKTTQLYRGLAAAMDLGTRHDAKLPARRVIVLLTDGDDDSSVDFTKDELMRRGGEQRLPIYAMGYLVPPRTQRKVTALQTLGELARWSGGLFLDADTAAIPVLYDRALQAIRRVDILYLTCARCVRDGQLRHLQVTLSTGSHVLADGIDVRLTPLEPPPAGKPRWEIAGGAGALVVLLALTAFALRPRRRPRPATPGSTPAPVHYQSPAAPVVQRDGVRLSLLPVGSRGSRTPRDVLLVDRRIIGRHQPDADIAFPDDEMMSSRHCELVLDRGIVIIRDLGSRNGTKVNGIKINPEHRLETADVILAGGTELRVEIQRS